MDTNKVSNFYCHGKTLFFLVNKMYQSTSVICHFRDKYLLCQVADSWHSFYQGGKPCTP